MARFSRSRTSRTVASVVVAAITIGAAYQFHRIRQSAAETASLSAPPPLNMSVNPAAPSSGSALTLATDPKANKPANPSIAPGGVSSQGTSIPGPLVTQTPDPTKPGTGKIPVIAFAGNTSGTAGNGSAGAQATSPGSGVAIPAGAPSIAPKPGQTPATPQLPSGALLSDAAAKIAAGDLIGARTELNSALLSGTLSATDAEAVKKQMAELSQTLIFSPRQFPKDPLTGVYQVKSGDRMASIGNSHQIPYELLLPLNRMTDAKKLRYGQVLKVVNGPFHAIVSKSKFTLDVYLGSPGGVDSTYITTFMVGLGTDNSTPTGTWAIKNKVANPAYFPPEGHAGGVLAPGDPKNPLGAFWMGLEGTDGQAVGQRSYGIHGTIDPTSVGKQSSMGCIRLKNEDVEVLYKMLMQGKSTVIVKD